MTKQLGKKITDLKTALQGAIFLNLTSTLQNLWNMDRKCDPNFLNWIYKLHAHRTNQEVRVAHWHTHSESTLAATHYSPRYPVPAAKHVGEQKAFSERGLSHNAQQCARATIKHGLIQAVEHRFWMPNTICFATRHTLFNCCCTSWQWIQTTDNSKI